MSVLISAAGGCVANGEIRPGTDRTSAQNAQNNRRASALGLAVDGADERTSFLAATGATGMAEARVEAACAVLARSRLVAIPTVANFASFMALSPIPEYVVILSDPFWMFNV
jgi:hypothetical protein